ncbi:lysophosphatidylserine lipase ABHD12-like [Daphnia carinata]|uniref:lysophosphatidylserine lipase ABHD12-like n=1 Tax=Daphnia carinata TaxID=120202 RepID=UPI0025810F17|nr:lysophosphatidylserine lipase ABHD12-like [Daphnia carinata]
MHHLVLSVVVITVIVIYVVLPLIFRYSATFQRQLVFLPYTTSLRWPIKVNYSQPKIHGLKGARNFYISIEPKVHVGAWHVLPRDLVDTLSDNTEQSLANGNPIVLYLHGNSGSRATGHRVELYKLLQFHNYHVIAFDYRGFADSTQVLMTENGATIDAIRVYEYIRQFSGKSTVIVWGHSLGSAVAIKMVAELCAVKQSPDRLILESPFNNIRDEFRNHPLTLIYRPLSVVDRFFTERLETNNVAFDSDVHIAGVECPTLFLHASDDRIVPISLTRKLYEAGLKSRPSNAAALQFIEFPPDLHCGHECIYSAPQLPSIIQQFVDVDRF